MANKFTIRDIMKNMKERYEVICYDSENAILYDSTI